MLELTELTVQKIIIKKFLADPSYTNVILSMYDERLFDTASLKLIGNFTDKYYKKYGYLPSDSIIKLVIKKEASNDLISTYKSIINLDIKQDEDYIRAEVLDYIRKKKFYYCIMDNIDDINDKGVDKVIKEFQDINKLDIYTELGMNYFEDIHNHLERIKTGEDKIQTLYPQLDYVLGGGMLTSKALYVFMSQAGMGKSLMLSNLAINFLMQHQKVLIISLEMSEDIYATRIDAHISKIKIGDIQNYTDVVEDKILKFKKTYAADLYIKEFPPSTISVNTIESYIDELGIDFDVIMVDYINLLNPIISSQNANSYERIGNVTKELRALSYKKDATVISPTQVNRSGFNNSEVDMENISESAQIAHHADFIGAIYQDEGDKEAGKIHVKVVKNRNGIVGKTLNLGIDYNTLRISDKGFGAEDEDEEASIGSETETAVESLFADLV